LSPKLLTRLSFDLIAAGLLLLGLSYWWLGNTVHELAGTGMFLLVIVHNVFNRRWYGRISTEKRHGRGLFNIGITFVLGLAMLVLLVTSVLISNALSGVMSAYGGFTVRQIHTLAAYWILVILSIHLGLRWPMIMGVARGLLGLTQASALRTLALRSSSSPSTASGAPSRSASAPGLPCRSPSTGGTSRNPSWASSSTASQLPGSPSP